MNKTESTVTVRAALQAICDSDKPSGIGYYTAIGPGEIIVSFDLIESARHALASEPEQPQCLECSTIGKAACPEHGNKQPISMTELRDIAERIANKITFRGKNFLAQSDWEKCVGLIMSELKSKFEHISHPQQPDVNQELLSAWQQFFDHRSRVFQAQMLDKELPSTADLDAILDLARTAIAHAEASAVVRNSFTTEAQPQKPDAGKECLWKFDQSICAYRASCGTARTFIDGEENKYRFCPYCGGKITLKLAKEGE